MRRPFSHRVLPIMLVPLFAVFVGCAEDDEGVGSDEEARRAYLGLDQSIEKSLNLGMDGFNAASSANIPDQNGTGEETGTIVISGQVDQGASANKNMRLYVLLDEYSDGPIPVEDEEDEDVEITYYTDSGDQPFLELKLRDIPDGTFVGTLVGEYEMEGDLTGTVHLDLMMDGLIHDPGDGTVARTPGMTHVTGVAHAGDGTYHVDVTL
jgi:hypothetical protein